MKVAKALFISASVLAFDLSLFQATISFSPEWSAALDAPEELISNPILLLAAGLLISILMAISGLYGLSGAGLIRRLPMLRLGLLVIGLGYTLLGISLVPQLLVLTHILSTTKPIIIEAVVASSIFLLTGLLYLAGLASGWTYLSVGVLRAVQGTRAERADAAARA